jgi:hypothetical protein
MGGQRAMRVMVADEVFEVSEKVHGREMSSSVSTTDQPSFLKSGCW